MCVLSSMTNGWQMYIYLHDILIIVWWLLACCLFSCLLGKRYLLSKSYTQQCHFLENPIISCLKVVELPLQAVGQLKKGLLVIHPQNIRLLKGSLYHPEKSLCELSNKVLTLVLSTYLKFDVYCECSSRTLLGEITLSWRTVSFLLLWYQI